MFAENLKFSLNASVPIFLIMVFGYICRKIELLDDHTTAKLNKFTFTATLPALLFEDLSSADFRAVWDTKFVLFCICATLLSVCAASLYSMLHKDKAERGEIIQASYRSSAAVLGIAFVKNIYGEAAMAALMIAGTVPLYNIIAVTALSVSSPKRKTRTEKALSRYAERYRYQPYHNRYSGRYCMVAVKDPSACDNSKIRILSWQHGNAPFVDSSRSIF